MSLIDPREGFTVDATAPSNIAFAKYWGKSDTERQWPANDSLSMTLADAVAETRVQRGPQNVEDVFAYDDRLVDRSSGHKAYRHIEFLRQSLGYAESLRVETRNTFPASCGIASSAAGMAALTVGAIAAWTGSENLDALSDNGFSRERLADLARMGSGSACRSLHGGFVCWRRGNSVEEQSYEVVADESHWSLSDIIVVVSSAAKEVGSTEAHRYAWSSPLFATRLAGHGERVAAMQTAITQRDLARLGPLLESEAIEMHSVAMTAERPITYINEKTENVLTWLRTERRDGGAKGYFTLDAGCNVHVITEDKDRMVAALKRQFPEAELLIDQVGSGPKLSRR